MSYPVKNLLIVVVTYPLNGQHQQEWGRVSWIEHWHDSLGEIQLNPIQWRDTRRMYIMCVEMHS